MVALFAMEKKLTESVSVQKYAYVYQFLPNNYFIGSLIKGDCRTCCVFVPVGLVVPPGAVAVDSERSLSWYKQSTILCSINA